jgi:hypothetical protein
MKIIYYDCYVYSFISYGIIFWGNCHLSGSIFKIQKGIIWIITNAGRWDSCCQLYKQLQIQPLPYQCIFSLLVCVNKNRSLFLSNFEMHDKNMRFNHNLHLPSTNLTSVQKGVLYSGSKIYNHLPLIIFSFILCINTSLLVVLWQILWTLLCMLCDWYHIC